MSDFSKPMKDCVRLQGVPGCSTNDPPCYDAKAYNEKLLMLRKMQSEAIGKPSHGNSFPRFMSPKLQSEIIGKPSHGNSFLQLMDPKLQSEAAGEPSHGNSFLQLMDQEPQASEERLSPAQPSKAAPHDITCNTPSARAKYFEECIAEGIQWKLAQKESEKKNHAVKEDEFEVIELHEGEEDDVVVVDDGIEDDYVEV